MWINLVSVVGGSQEVWDFGKLAEGIHNGRHTHTVEERDGGSS